MVTVSLPLDDALAASLEQQAKASGVSVADFVRVAIRHALDDAMLQAAVDRGLDDVKHGRVVDGDAMDRWLGSWGSDDEQEPPACPE